MKFIQDFFISILQFGRYPELLKNSKKRVFFHGAFVVFLFWSITVLRPTVSFVAVNGGVRAFVERNVPEFAFTDGRLTLDGRFHYADGKTYIDIDTSEGYDAAANKKELRTRAELNDYIGVGDSEKIILNEPTAADGLRTIYYKDLGLVDYKRSDLIEAAPRIESFLMMVMGGQYLLHMGLFFLELIGAAYLGGMFAKLTGVKIRFGEIYKLAVYTRTLPLILKGALISAGYVFPEYSAMSLLYTIFVLTRAFRFLAYQRAVNTVEETFRSIQLPDDEFSIRRREENEDKDSGEDASAEEDRTQGGWERVPTPKTPDGYALPKAPDDAATKTTADTEASKTQDGEKAKPFVSNLPKNLTEGDLKPNDGWSFGHSITQTPAEETEKASETDEDTEQK